jgi:hypothetical protein
MLYASNYIINFYNVNKNMKICYQVANHLIYVYKYEYCISAELLGLARKLFY